VRWAAAEDIGFASLALEPPPALPSSAAPDRPGRLPLVPQFETAGAEAPEDPYYKRQRPSSLGSFQVRECKAPWGLEKPVEEPVEEPLEQPEHSPPELHWLAAQEQESGQRPPLAPPPEEECHALPS
jgi:hypothetical protein